MKTQKKKISNKQNNNPVAASSNGKLAHDDIACAAYCLWEQEGRPQGRDMDHWIRAEALLKQNPKQHAAET